MLGEAIALMSFLFEKVRDKGGQPYALHCLRVWNGVKHLSIDAQCAAILHDVVEDTTTTFKDLVTMGYSMETIRIVVLLTHNSDDSYDDYIKKIATCELASQIKMSDIRDNSQFTRLKGATKKDFDRMEKYQRAYIYLSKL